MSKDRFLELLNLYLDNEIQDQETQELFTAMDSKEEYRRLYDEYSKMTLACSMTSPAKFEVRTRRNISQVVYAVGGLAAAFTLVGLAARNLEPIFQKTDDPVVLAPVARQMNAEQVLGPELVQMASFASNWDNHSTTGFRFDSAINSESEQIDRSSWKGGLNLEFDSSDYSMSHELSLVLDEKTKAELLSNVVDGSKKEGFLNYQYSRKDPVRLSISADKETPLTKIIDFDASSGGASQ